MERCNIRFCEIKLAEGGTKTGVFTGYGAYFNNEDSYGDVIAPGAFKGSLADWEARGKYPPMLLQHGGGLFGGGSDDMVPVGVWDSMKEDKKGLKVEGRLIAMQTDRGQYIYEAMKEGAFDGLSIGFRTRQAINGTKPGEPDRTLTDIDLWEVSLVTFPANPKARISSVKTLTVDQWRDFEASLCEAGMSRQHARLAVARFKRLGQCDAGNPEQPTLREAATPADPQMAEMLKSLDALQARMLLR